MSGKYFSKWRTILSLVFVLVVIGLAAQAGRLIHLRINARTNAQAVRVRGPIPYTVTLKEVIHAPDGTTRMSREIIQAIRSDGSMVERSTTDRGSDRSLYFSSGLQVGINELHNTKTSMTKPNWNPTSSQRDPNSKCLNSLAGKPVTSSDILVGEETIAGYRTVKIASGRVTEWRALDYGCALLKDRWEFNAKEVTEKELVALVAGEPDASLFEVPANYREVPPSEGARPCNQSAQKFLQMMDEDYKRHGAARIK